MLQVAEVNGRNRTTVILPESGWVDFRDMLNGLPMLPVLLL